MASQDHSELSTKPLPVSMLVYYRWNSIKKYSVYIILKFRWSHLITWYANTLVSNETISGDGKRSFMHKLLKCRLDKFSRVQPEWVLSGLNMSHFLMAQGKSNCQMGKWIFAKFSSKSYIICVEKCKILKDGLVKMFGYI